MEKKYVLFENVHHYLVLLSDAFVYSHIHLVLHPNSLRYFRTKVSLNIHSVYLFIVMKCTFHR